MRYYKDETKKDYYGHIDFTSAENCTRSKKNFQVRIKNKKRIWDFQAPTLPEALKWEHAINEVMYVGAYIKPQKDSTLLSVRSHKSLKLSNGIEIDHASLISAREIQLLSQSRKVRKTQTIIIFVFDVSY